MKRSILSALVLVALVIGVSTLLSPAPQAARACVDPDLCPIVICPPGTTFVPTSCKECAHCEPNDGCPGKRPCEEPL